MKPPRRKKQRGGRRRWQLFRDAVKDSWGLDIISFNGAATSSTIFMRAPLVFDETAEFTEDDCGVMMSLLEERDA